MPALVERNQVGKREDLADLIAVVDSKDTPFYSMAPKGKAPGNTLVEWQVDQYDSQRIGGIIDGDEVKSFDNKASARVRMRGRVQKFRRTYGVSDMAENVSDVAGIGTKGEMNRAAAKSLVEIKRDMEARFCSDQDSQADSGTVPYQTRGVGAWIQSTATTDLPVDSKYLTPSTSISTVATGTMADADLQNVFASIYGQTGQIKDLVALCGPTFKIALTAFTQYQKGVSSTVANNRYFTQDANSKKVLVTIDFYQGDFGAIQLHPSLFLGINSDGAVGDKFRCYILDFNNVEIAFNRLPKISPLEDRGGGPRAFVDAITVLKVYNPLSLGKFAATS